MAIPLSLGHGWPENLSVYRQEFAVAVSYPVVFEDDCLARGSQALSWCITRLEPERVHRVVLLADQGLVDATPSLLPRAQAYFAAHGQSLTLVCEPLLVPGGEAAKNDPRLLSALLERFVELHLDRQVAVVAFGGGAMLDLVGYAVATFHRGMRLVRVPTTVLAQDDSGVGVKNGINAWGAKNLLGTFAPPFAVVNDSTFFATLEPRDRRAGMAEAVKVALVRDAKFFYWLEAQVAALSSFEQEPLAQLVRRAAELHLVHIATGGDPFELGSARPLDYGHWSAHKLELLTAHELRHGEAVAIGITIDTLYAAQIGLLSPSEAGRIVALLAALGFRLFHPALELVQAGQLQLLSGLEEFREHLGGELTVTLLQGIGRPCDVHHLDITVLAQVLALMKLQYS